MTCNIVISGVRFNNIQPNIEFERPNGDRYTWNKMVVKDENGDNMWLSVDDAVVAKLGDDLKTIMDHKMECYGTMRTYRGVSKFKITDIDFVK